MLMRRIRATVGWLLVAVAMLALGPALARAELKKGDPELYSNGILIGTGEAGGVPQIGYGDIEFESGQIPGGFFECTTLGMATGYNAGTPARGVGQILAWTAAGHAAGETHGEVSSECRGFGGVVWATDEAPIEAESAGEATRGALTTPWNVEADCGTRTGEKVPVVKIGVPTSRTESERKAAEERACKTEAAEATEVESEVAKKEGCYRSRPSPAGCIAFLWVAPSLGYEVGFAGTLRARAVNGVGNGLDQTRWEFQGGKFGELQCTFPIGCTAKLVTFGEVKQQGFEAAQLITVK